MLPIKKAHVNHYYDFQTKWATNADADIALLAILYNGRVRFTGTYFIPLAAVAGDRAIHHWLMVDEHGMATYVCKDTRRHGTRATSGPLKEMIDRLPDKDANGAIVKKYMLQQINKEVAYGKFPFPRKANPPPAVLGEAIAPLTFTGGLHGRYEFLHPMTWTEPVTNDAGATITVNVTNPTEETEGENNGP